MGVLCAGYESIQQTLDTMNHWAEPFEGESVTVFQCLKNGVSLITYPVAHSHDFADVDPRLEG